MRTANSVSLLGYAYTTVVTSDQSQLWQLAYQLAISTSSEAHCAEENKIIPSKRQS